MAGTPLQQGVGLSSELPSKPCHSVIITVQLYVCAFLLQMGDAKANARGAVGALMLARSTEALLTCHTHCSTNSQKCRSWLGSIPHFCMQAHLLKGSSEPSRGREEKFKCIPLAIKGKSEAFVG